MLVEVHAAQAAEASRPWNGMTVTRRFSGRVTGGLSAAAERTSQPGGRPSRDDANPPKVVRDGFGLQGRARSGMPLAVTWSCTPSRAAFATILIRCSHPDETLSIARLPKPLKNASFPNVG
jgi:hypothetical protein